MVRKILEGQVVNGQLHLAESLEAYEGQRVQVILAGKEVTRPEEEIEPPADMDVEKDAWVPVPFQQEGVEADEPPLDLDVEKDVYMKMPFATVEIPDADIVDAGPLPPCIILPEGVEKDGSDE